MDLATRQSVKVLYTIMAGGTTENSVPLISDYHNKLSVFPTDHFLPQVKAKLLN